MVRLLSICLALITAFGEAVAQPRSAENGIAHCANIATSKKRLACYDKLADDLKKSSAGWDGDSNGERLAQSARVIQGFRPTGHGDWAVRESVSSDGSKDVALAIFTTGRASGRSSGALSVALWLRCSDDRTLLYIDWNAIVDIGGRSVVRMQSQIDGAAPSESHWSRYSDHNVTGLYGNRASIRFIRQLYGRSTLHAKLNEQSAAYSASFNVSGLEQAITPLRTACAW